MRYYRHKVSCIILGHNTISVCIRIFFAAFAFQLNEFFRKWIRPDLILEDNAIHLNIRHYTNIAGIRNINRSKTRNI